jgi:hypothetical protein
MLLVLVPVPTAEHCLLNEAVQYAALGRLPLNRNPLINLTTKTGWQEREDFRWQQAVSEYLSESGLPGRYVPSGTSIPPQRYEEAGVDLSPLLDAIGSGPKGSPPINGDDGAAVTRREESFEKWEVFLDAYRLQVRNSLHAGRLTARGKKLPERVGIDEAPDIDLPVDSRFESIPREFWASANVEWKASCAQGRSATYKFIQVLTDDLFKEFPLPDPRPAPEVLQMGDNFVFSGELNTEPVMPSVVGRPPYPWDEFYVEVAKRVKEGKLPEKQEAFISDMQAWCRNRWGQEVGRSTLLQKIKPYYDEFVRQRMSENDL